MGSVTQLKLSSAGDSEPICAPESMELFSVQDRQTLLGIIREKSFKTGRFTLSSGQESNLYFNMKPTMMDPLGAALGARAFIELMLESGAEYVSGLEMGAVPAIGAMAAVGELLGLPVKTTFVRKRKKEHGTQDIIEGLGPNETLAGKTVFVVDDVHIGAIARRN